MQDKNNHRKFTILFASRLVAEKGIQLVIDAIESWGGEQKDVEWVFCSDGEERGSIESLSQKYINVTYHGKVSRAKLAILYRTSDVLLMPSVFLETFGLTALEAAASGLAIIGPRKGGLSDFISPELEIDESHAEESIREKIEFLMKHQEIKLKISAEGYREKNWKEKLQEIFLGHERILIVHDYADSIGGAEIYVESVGKALTELGKTVEYIRYHGKTTSILRKLLFVSALFSYRRQKDIEQKIRTFAPDAIWMHSVLRYHGIWSLRQIEKYTQTHTETKIFLSHHDVGLIAPFPQIVEQEKQIPANTSLREFTKGLKGIRRVIAGIKCLYVKGIKYFLPKNTEHIIFSPFLEKHIKHHFPNQKSIILPHTFDEKIFHP